MLRNLGNALAAKEDAPAELKDVFKNIEMSIYGNQSKHRSGLLNSRGS